MTPAEIIYHRRVRVLDHAGTHSVAESCRTFGISRQSYYRWANRAKHYGLAALMPKTRRVFAQPNVTPPHVVEIVLAEAVARPTLGARALLEHLEERSVVLSASGAQKILTRHHLGHRSERVAALATLTAATTGLATQEALEGPFGFCHFAARAGDLVALDTFYVGKPKGVGAVYQFTAIDTATRWAVCQVFTGEKTAGVLSDNGPEFTGRAFTTHLADLGVTHHRIPPRSPNHNAGCERFQGTALQERWRPAFHRQRFDTLGELDRVLQAWLERYNTHRRNRGAYMAGRTPLEVLNQRLPSPH